MYLAYSDYQAMGGSLTQAEYPRASNRAEAEFDRRTFNRYRNAETIPERVRWCIFELIETVGAGIKMYESPEGRGAIMATSNDGVSESYGNASMADWTGTVLPERIAQIVGMYMDNELVNGINATYRGMG